MIHVDILSQNIFRSQAEKRMRRRRLYEMHKKYKAQRKTKRAKKSISATKIPLLATVDAHLDESSPWV